MERSNSSVAGSERGRMALRVAVLLGLLHWVGSTGSALAAGTFIVDAANPGCSDTAPGAGTEGNPPYCTISAAASARGGPGTTLLVKPAVYREEVRVPASGAEGSPFVFQALGPGVVVDGADDFSDPAVWTLFSGDVWLARTVTRSPDVFVDGARLGGSGAEPAALPAGSFRYIAGEGLYVNLGGDNPGTHQTLISLRGYSFYIAGRSWVTIDGFTVTRAWIYAKDASNITVTHNTVTFASIHLSRGANVLVGSNLVSDSRSSGIHLFAIPSATIQDNEVFRNVHRSGFPEAHGIYLDGSRDSLLQRNNVHDNRGTGITIDDSSNTLSVQNRFWHNGGHGFHHSRSSSSRHVGDVAWENGGRGFSLGWEATDTHIFNSIGVNNGLTTGEFDLFVESTAAPGFVSNTNLFWNRTSQPPIKYAGTRYTTIAAFTTATGHDAASLQADPRFLHPEAGDFRLLPGSPAIDSADSSVPNWPATDAAGQARVDDPATPDTGAGPVSYADRGALEFLPTGPPLAALTVTPTTGRAPLTVTADASPSVDPDGTIVAYRIDFGDGTVVGPQEGATAIHTYPGVGTFTVIVTVTDDEGGIASATAAVTVAPPTQPPVAALRVTPASGTLAMTADASGSSDPDGRIVSYRFDFGDGIVVGPQAEATALHNYRLTGVFTATVTVTDDLGAIGLASTTVTVAPPDGNWASNDDFEGSTSGWSAYGGATLKQIPGGIDGGFALEVRGLATSAEFGINDSPNWVAKTPAAGARYRFSAWVRSPVSNARARLRVREYLNGLQVGGTTVSPFLALTPAWQLVLVDHVTGAASSTLDFQVLAVPLASGPVFETDHIAIRIVTSTTNQPPNGVIDTPTTDVTIAAGTSVTFSSTGSDPDNHVPLTYLWDFVGGEPQRTGEDPGGVTFGTPGTYTVTLTVTDSLGLADPTPASRAITVSAATPPNLVGNPSFEADTSGWSAYGGATLQRVPGGQEGAVALEVRGPASTATFGINDSPNWVSPIRAAGTRYRFTAWVRAETHTGQARLRVREYNNGTQVGPTVRSAPVTLSPAWQMLTVDLVAGAAGSTLDVQVLDYIPITTGEVFQVDNIGIRLVP